MTSGALAELREKARQTHLAGDLDAALPLYVRYLAEVPGDAAMWSNLGVLFRRTSRPDQALRAYARARAIDPDDIGFMNNEANTLNDIGRYEEAIALRRRILSRRPDDVNQLSMIGRALRSMGRLPQSIDHLRGAVARFPDEAELHLQLALSLLAAGDFAEGFRRYQSRWQTGELKPRDWPMPKWQPGDPLEGKTVLVVPEQGFGDAILFLRLLPLLRARAAKVVYLSERPLIRLLQGIEGADRVVGSLPDGFTADYHMPLMDLPLLGLDTPADIPPPTRLSVPADSIAGAEALTAPYRDRFRVGVVWSGSETFKGNDFRSFSHRHLLPLADVPGVQLFSLYKGPRTAELHADGTSAFILDAGSGDRDFADCAANMQAMDLVITSDTATLHLAGSLGVPTWAVLHWDAFWFFGHEGDTTPWYPGMRLFRQDSPRDWEGVFARVEAALRDRVAEARS